MLPFQRVCQELSKVGISQKDVEKGNENDNIPVWRCRQKKVWRALELHNANFFQMYNLRRRIQDQTKRLLEYNHNFRSSFLSNPLRKLDSGSENHEPHVTWKIKS